MSVVESSQQPAVLPDAQSVVRRSFLNLTSVQPFLATLIILGCLWVFGRTIGDLIQVWTRNPDYAHGFLVPLMAGYIAWLRRASLREIQPSASGWGVLVIAVAVMLHLAGLFYFLEILSRLAVVVACGGLVLLIAGKRIAWTLCPAILFLVFMIPLPGRVETWMALPLQRLATQSSAYVLQTLGCPAIAEGTIVLIDDRAIEIVRACSGLRMLMSFFCITIFVTIVVNHNWIIRIIVALSIVPLALIANILRIVTTGLLLMIVDRDLVEHIFHDVSGYLMMPLALALLVAELFVLSKLIVKVPVERVR